MKSTVVRDVLRWLSFVWASTLRLRKAVKAVAVCGFSDRAEVRRIQSILATAEREDILRMRMDGLPWIGSGLDSLSRRPRAVANTRKMFRF